MRFGRKADIRGTTNGRRKARRRVKRQHTHAHRRAGKLLLEDAPRERRLRGWLT